VHCHFYVVIHSLKHFHPTVDDKSNYPFFVESVCNNQQQCGLADDTPVESHVLNTHAAVDLLHFSLGSHAGVLLR